MSAVRTTGLFKEQKEQQRPELSHHSFRIPSLVKLVAIHPGERYARGALILHCFYMHLFPDSEKRITY